MPATKPAIWPPFVRASIAIAVGAGFGLGLLLFASMGSGFAHELWWPATAQAHGHAQIAGWAGLMVLGVGLHFLPRLASAPPLPAHSVRLAFWILTSGLIARTICQPALAIAGHPFLETVFQLGWVVGALAELAGAASLLVMLDDSFRSTLPLRPDAAIRQVLPFLLAGLVALLVFLGGSALATIDVARNDIVLINARQSNDLALVGLYCFLTPISIGMSIRIFPLYFRTRPARYRMAQIGLGLLLSGLLFRRLDTGISPTAGRTLILLASVMFVLALRVLEPRRPLPRRRAPLWQDAPGLHIVSAYLWLLAAAMAQMGGPGWLRLELHLLGAGFVTLLILGSAVHLIPAFARQPLRNTRYIWATLLLGNLATITRAIPAAPAIHLSPTIEQHSGTIAGIAGVAALCCFALNLRDALGPKRASPPATVNEERSA